MRPEAADDRHHVGRGDRDVEVVEALLDALGEVLAADDVGAGLLGLARLVALGEDGDLDVLAEAVGQRDRAAQLLVGVAHVQAGADVDLDRLVELRAGRGCARARPPRRARTRARGRPWRARSRVALAVLAHDATSTPIERAVPAMILAACSTSWAFRSASLRSAISRSCCLGDRADLDAVRLARALVDPERLADQHGGGRRLGDERERAVLVDGDHDRDDGAGFALRLRVERLAELHDVDPVLAQRRTDRRGGARLPGVRLQLDRCQNLLGHSVAYLCWRVRSLFRADRLSGRGKRGKDAGAKCAAHTSDEDAAWRGIGRLELLHLVEADLDGRLATED